MIGRLKSELAYARGLLRALRRTGQVARAREVTLGNHLERWAALYADRPVLESETETLTYRDLNARANRYARWARAEGLNKGDTVCLFMPNRPEYVAIWMGLARAGLATALINTNLTGATLAHSVALAGAKAAIVDSALADEWTTAKDEIDDKLSVFAFGPSSLDAPRLDLKVLSFAEAPLSPEERPKLTHEDAALYIYTSGTTGLPKAARITHSRLLRILVGFAAVVGARPTDRIYQCLPMYHTNGGVITVGIAMAAGGSCFIRRRFSAHEFWREIVDRRCTMFVYVGELCRYLLNMPPGPLDRAHGVRLCIGNGLRPDIFSAFKTRFGLKTIVEFYAATEGNVALFNFDSYPGAVGRMPNWAAKRFPIKTIAFDIDQEAERRDANGRCIECGIDEVGELIGEILDDAAKPAARFDGYADAQATNDKILRNVFKDGDAWFRTGDLLRRDALGYYYFVDRIGDTFRWKGENVSTTEVAETIMLFPGVRHAIVYGVAVPNHDGRAGMAALVVEDPAAFDLKAFRAFVAERLPTYARPLFLRFRPEIEVTGTFKPKKTALVAQGFDPAKVGELVYYDDKGAGRFIAVSPDLIVQISSGAMKL